ncbi:deoxyguanosinetriphosphate triphosphohydrolase [Dongia deserti]|uniref:deoxyguanosinetriphosphate triphosphohydrolase n=1 Tax=Dongia deserti TaxID=2268030 RepID=UPI000E649D54|nr:deoxyguanosinetriphosphate triphosphohydrolase [Dongia deserti]
MQSFASNPQESRGRLVAEEESATRSPFQRDRDRIIHSTAFRRLKHKTQVFVYHEGDHFRTRLTHSIEVAQIARSIARSLGLNEDLAEAVALAHDLGHTPFGHAGEEALAHCMAEFGGFDHNEQTFRIVTLLERRYAAFDGLNLTWEALEGVVKHNGPLIGPHASAKALAKPVPSTISSYCAEWDLEIGEFAGPEAQVAAISDDIAYNNHDIDDGLRAGLFTLADLKDVPLAGPVIADVSARYPGLELSRLIHESIRRMINLMVRDVIAESTRRLVGIKSVAQVRARAAPVIAFSDEMRTNDRALKEFLFARMYRHHRVNQMTMKAKRVVSELFELHLAQPQCLPAEWQALMTGLDEAARARLVADYIAGMTDKFALETHRHLFDLYERL